MSRPILFGVSSNEAGWQAAVHTVVHRIGRHFGFQAFNKDPQTSQGPSEPTWTPATIFLVTDHLYHLLVKNYMRRDTAPGTDDDCFGRAVFRLHDAIFQGYRDWCEHVVLPPVLKELALETLLKYGPVVEWEYLLEELALYFLIYSESANVRHTPEALWFVFWLLRNSRDKFNQVTSPPPGDPRSAAFATHSDLMRGLMKKRCHLRNKYQAQIKQWRGDCGIKGDGDHVPVADLVKMHAYARHEVLAAGLFPSAEAIEVDLLAELVAYGDSGPFLDRVVTPIFGYLAIQVDKMGSSGREIATRVTYDDCNESLCSKEVVHKVLGLLGVKIEPKSGRIIMQTDPYDALLAVGQVSLNVAAAAVAGTNAGASPARESSTAEKKLPGDSLSVQLGWDWKAAREWWARFVFGKTYVERRSVFTMYRTFYRIWAFFILEFQVMSVLLWGWGSWYALSSVCLTHAGLSLLEQMAGAWTQRAPVKGLRVWGNPFWGRFSKGIVDWLAINTVLWLCLVAQLTDFFSGVKIWWYVAAGYTGLVVAHAVLSTRDGYCISISHSLAAMFRRWARANSCCCGFLWRLLAWFWTRVGASSARPPPKLYLAPYQMRTGWDDFLANVVFWACVIAAKFAFDWFAVMKTLEAPVLGLWNRNWLSTGSGNIWINGKDTGIPKPDGDFILCIARCMPGFLVMFNDMQVFYYVVMAVFGAVKGLVQLNLGSITTFQELVISFHKAPFRWWEAGVSKKGASNILRAINAAAAQSQEGAEAAPALPPMARRVSGDAAINDMIARRNLDRQKLSYTERLIQTTQDMAKTSESKKVKSYFSDDNIARWLVFSDVWNAVVEELRAVDLVSDSERDNLCFVHLDIDETIEIVEGMRPFMLPIFFYGGQINRALEVPGVDSGQHVALTEIRALLVWLLLQLGIVDKAQADAMLHFVPLERPTTLDHRTKRNMGVVEVVKFLKGLQAIQGKTPDDPARRNRWATAQGLHENLAKLCDILLVEVKAVVEEYPWGPNGPTDSNPGRIMHGRAAALKEVVEQLRGTLLDPWSWSAFLGEQGGLAAIYAEAEDLASKRCISKVVRHLLRMLETSAKGAQPRGDEAQRILSFFMSSLKNPTLGTPPSISEMLSFNTLTPHYEEDVIYALNAANVARHFHLDATAARGLADLVRENEDGISVMQWLKSVYQRDWQNLMERLKPKLNGLDPRHVTEEDFDVGGPLHHAQMELLLWASYRGQLLARTVRGMMAYENALRLLAHLENPKPANMADVKYEALVEDLVRSKFTYVVASQVYAANRNSTTARGRWLARGIDLLLHQYPGLRVAYIDTQYAETGSQQYSVLIRGRIGIPASDPNCTEELYRIRLPQNRETNHGVILGEGKPENQNAAIIFCFGEIIQAIDMNQANYLCEALKMRNLVSEFNPPHYDNGAAVGAVVPPPAPERPQPLKPGSHAPGTTYDVHATVTRLAAASAGCAEQPWPNMRQQPVCLVGFREWIFSQDSGALASFAAATEFTFGSMVQRVMTWPANVRFHYGHPDLWNKLFVMSRGGVSKATRAFHISEDVFAGYNHTLRGGKTKFKEYIQVGKGRDMGFDSINGFESKVAGGNGEQVVSRDVHRLGTQLDFFRLLAFYQSGPGFYINTYLVMLSVYANIWVLLLLALTDSQVVIDPRTDEPVSSVTGQGDSVAVQQIVQLGMFSIITYAVELVLEYGVVKSLATIFVQLLQGSIAFFIFRSRTSAYYFKSDVQYGGAKYISTGRGYALKHNSFVKVYTTYARSHLYFAMELVVMLVLLALVSTTAYASTTWSTWMVAVCILWSPFWFNPQTFQLERCKDDFEAWVLWMTDVTDTETGSTWYSWNKAQLEKPRNENLSQTNPYATALRGVLNSLPTAILAVAAVTSMGATRWNNWAVFGVATGGFWALVGSIFLLRSYLLAHYRYRIWRLMRTALVVLLLGFVVCAIIFIPSVVSAGVGFKNIFIIVFANLYLVVVCAQLLLYLRRGSLKARYLVDSAYRVMDWAIGYLLFAILFVLSFLQVFDLVQGALLFNMKFSKALQRARLLEANFLTSYVDRAMERIGKQVKEDITGGQQQQATPGRSPNVSPARPPGLPASPGMGAKSPGKAQ